MASYQTIVYEKVEDKIFRLTLNRPEKLNALSQHLLAEFELALSEFESDNEASVLVIRGAGRAFSAGYDLQGTQQPGSGFSVSTDRVNLQRTVARWQRLWAVGKPTIAQVHGYCLAGATELAGHCDLVFASEDAQFGHPAGRSLGILPTLSMWPILMGAREALEWHLINRVYSREQLEAETLAYARRVAMVPLELLALHKAAVNRYLDVLGFRALEQSAADLDCIAHQTEAVKNWMKASREKGLKEALTERDRPFGKK